ncbi:phosphopantetheine-binding protein [Paractinoplanes durhamensis]|uniref:phosphopantetheine-binding protein n=1 Tax=Paractinoplanes durhamensis TaxID=113563 RepID=UPI0036292662
MTETTPLLEWGILNSLNTATLIGYVREELGTAIPLSKVTATTFRDVRSISAMLYEAGEAASA